MNQSYAVKRVLDHFPNEDPQRVIWRLEQSTSVDLHRRFLYFDVPKAAGTQMKHLLRHIAGAGPIKLFTEAKIQETRRDLYVHARVNMPLPSLVELDDTVQKEVLESPDFLRFTVVRNPYARLLSAWRNKVYVCDGITGRDAYLGIKGRLPEIHEKLLISFDEFVRYVEGQCNLPDCDIHWVRQVDYTYFPAMNFSFVGKVEQLDETLRRLERHLGLTEPLVASGRNESLPVGTASYTKELADKVYSTFQADFEMLQYDRESWAAQRRRNPSPEPGVARISEERLRDEIVERNLVILSLFEERERLQAQLRRVSRLHVFPIANALAAFRSAVGKAIWGAEGWERRTIHPRPLACNQGTGDE